MENPQESSLTSEDLVGVGRTQIQGKDSRDAGAVQPLCEEGAHHVNATGRKTLPEGIEEIPSSTGIVFQSFPIQALTTCEATCRYLLSSSGFTSSSGTVLPLWKKQG